MSKTSLIFLLYAVLLLCLQNVTALPYHEEVSEDSLHYALHAVHPHFKDGVFTSNQHAMEVLEREDKLLASKVYALAKRQSNSTVTTANAGGGQPAGAIQTPNTPIVTPAVTLTTPYTTTSSSTYETVLTSPNGQRSTRTTFAIVVATVTPIEQNVGTASNPAVTESGNASLQSFGIRANEYPTAMMLLLLSINIVVGFLWVNV